MTLLPFEISAPLIPSFLTHLHHSLKSLPPSLSLSTLPTEEDLLTQLSQLNKAFGDPSLYEEQISIILANLGKGWSGEETERVVRDVVEASLLLMEMVGMGAVLDGAE
jgi:hypothetical protein